MKIILSLALSIILTAFGYGQVSQIEWKTALGGSQSDLGIDVIETADGGYLVLSVVRSNDSMVSGNHGNKDVWLAKLDANRNLEWQRCYGGSDEDHPRQIVRTSDGKYLLLAVTQSNNGDVPGTYGIGGLDIWVVKIDTDGDIIWSRIYGGSANEGAASIKPTPDGGAIIAGSTSSNNHDVSFYYSINGTDAWLLKIDGSGDLEWEKSLGGTSGDQFADVILTDDGGYVALANTRSDDHDVSQSFGDNDIWVVKLDAQRNVIWDKTLGGSRYDGANSIIATKDKGYLVLGVTVSNDSMVTNNRGGGDLWLAKLDSVGNLQWQKTYGGTSEETIEISYRLLQLSDGTYFIGGITKSTNGDITLPKGLMDIWIARIDPIGNIIWKRTIGGSEDDVIKNLYLTRTEDVLIIGTTESTNFDMANLPSFNPLNDEDIYFAKLSVDLVQNVASGTVYHDINGDCVLDANDQILNNVVINQTLPSPHYFSTDSFGHYALLSFDTGLYQWQPIIPTLYEPLLTDLCDTFHRFDFDTIGIDTSGFNFGLQIEPCPILSVNIMTDRRRPCVASRTVVNFCNKGITDTSGIQAIIQLPEYVTLLNVSMPYTINVDGHLVVDIDTLRATECEQIVIIDSLDCNPALLGQTSCAQAWITPGNKCYNDLINNNGIWDLASFQITGSCNLADSIFTFVVINNGADMSAISRYRLLSGTGILYSDTFRLKGGDSLVVDVADVTGYMRMEVENTAFNPDGPIVFAEVNNCLGNNTLSSAIPYPQFDENVATDVSCLTIRNSYDPNDKQVVPSGILSTHLVEKGVRLEYTIRFQNTGTDTAYRVEIIDTLSPYLNIATLELGASSHKFEYYIDGGTNPVIHFVFNDIMLVDSFTNETLSHGFISYEILPNTNTASNTVINNFADIYFDFNTPVRTNTAYVTIVDGLVSAVETATVTVDGDVGVSVKGVDVAETIVVYPNPNEGKALFVNLTLDSHYDEVLFIVYSVTGQQLLYQSIRSGQNIVETDLHDGFYIYHVKREGSLLKAGKISVVK